MKTVNRTKSDAAALRRIILISAMMSKRPTPSVSEVADVFRVDASIVEATCKLTGDWDLLNRGATPNPASA